MKKTACITLAVLLAACGSQPARQSERIEAPVETAAPAASAKPAKKPNKLLKRGGGFYKDDGPSDDIPDNLDDIPNAEPRIEPLHRFANKPYVVLGKSYVPNTRLKPYKTQGIASWYGKKFHGQKTSIGEPYDMFSMTAAHPTLAIPSYVRVRNANSGKAVIVRVTDRGPFHADRVIDLSYVAAYKLGLIDNGSGQVDVEAILPESYAATTLRYEQIKPPTPAIADNPYNSYNAPDAIKSMAQQPASEAATQHGVFLQLGAFANADNAESLRAHLTRELDWLTEGIQINAGGGMSRVHLGPYATRSAAEKVAEKIRLALGYKPTFVTR